MMHKLLYFSCRGYCAPEYNNDGKMSFKTDIYSLGAIIIELVTGRKEIPDKNNVRVNYVTAHMVHFS